MSLVELGLLEAPRDQRESAFTSILRRLALFDEGVLAVVCVDSQGECVDYCSRMAPYDAKVIGAQMVLLAQEVWRRMECLPWGLAWEVELESERRAFVVRRLSEGYALVVAHGALVAVGRVHDALERAVRDFRLEARMETPEWDPQWHDLHVEVRSAVGWPYAPAGVVQRGQRTELAVVLGRWAEGDLVCFRVQAVDGDEFTLAHDVAFDRWMRR